MLVNKENLDELFNELSNILIFIIFNRDVDEFNYIEQNIQGILSSAREGALMKWVEITEIRCPIFDGVGVVSRGVP